MRSIISALLCMILTPLAAAAPPALLADLNTTQEARSSIPSRVGWVAGSTVPDDFAIIRSANSGTPLSAWITDGTEGSTLAISGLPSFVPPAQVSPLWGACTATGILALYLNRPGTGYALFGVDPATGQATRLLEGGGLVGVVVVNERFLFIYDDGVHGRELWTSAGTVAGTSILLDLSPGAAASSINILNSNGAQAWVSVKPAGSPVRSLYITDGTADGTHPIGPVSPTDGDALTYFSALVTGGLVYQARDSGSSDTRLYFATPTAGPTAAIASTSGPISLGTTAPVSTGSHALFVGTDAGSTQHLFVTDGLTATATSESLLFFGPDLAILHDAAAPFGWIACFPGGPSSNSSEPCRSDGTRAGTYMIADLNAGDGPSGPFGFTAAGNRAYFRTASYINEGGPYNAATLSTDGTATSDLGSLPGAPSDAVPITSVLGQPLFAASDAHGRELWRFDPEASVFNFISDLWPGDASPSGPLIVSVASGSAVLTAETAVNPQQILVTDGTPPGTLPALATGVPLTASFLTRPMPLGSFGEQFAIFARAGPTGEEPWLINPHTGAAAILRDIRTGPQGSQPGASFFSPTATFGPSAGSFTFGNVSSAATGERTVFTAAPAMPAAGATYAVWSTDGTAPNTVELTRHRSEAGPPKLVFNYTTLGTSAYFFAPPLASESPPLDNDLWMTDGTAAGTRRVVSLRSIGIFSGSATQLAAWNGRLYFTASVSGVARLFSSNGTTAGTSLAAIGPEAGALPIGSIFPTGVGLIFTAGTASGGMTLWATDNTPTGTRRLTPSGPESQYAGIGAVYDAGTLAFFTMWTRPEGRELWATDGTAAGTRLVSDLNPGPESSDPNILSVLSDHRLIFAAYTPDRGIELWQSDGTAFGTRLIADLVPGPGSSIPTNAALLGPNLIFTADDGSSVGQELWTVPLTPPCRCDVNNSGATSVQDIFDFLSLYFSGRGDFNADGATGVQDIFDFLSCWFVGCT